MKAADVERAISVVDIETIIDAYGPGEGRHWFDRATLRYFRGRLPRQGYNGRDGTYFVTSEQFDAASLRLYTVRRLAGPGKVETVGEFQQYATPEAAARAAKRAAAGAS